MSIAAKAKIEMANILAPIPETISCYICETEIPKDEAIEFASLTDFTPAISCLTLVNCSLIFSFAPCMVILAGVGSTFCDAPSGVKSLPQFLQNLATASFSNPQF